MIEFIDCTSMTRDEFIAFPSQYLTEKESMIVLSIHKTSTLLSQFYLFLLIYKNYDNLKGVKTICQL